MNFECFTIYTVSQLSLVPYWLPCEVAQAKAFPVEISPVGTLCLSLGEKEDLEH